VPRVCLAIVDREDAVPGVRVLDDSIAEDGARAWAARRQL